MVVVYLFIIPRPAAFSATDSGLRLALLHCLLISHHVRACRLTNSENQIQTIFSRMTCKGQIFAKILPQREDGRGDYYIITYITTHVRPCFPCGE